MTEITGGMEALRLRGGAAARADRIRSWLDRIVRDPRERILGLDLAVAEMTGILTAQLASRGLRPGFRDVAVASIARVHDLVVPTRNMRHFASTGTRVLDPFDAKFLSTRDAK